MASVVNSFAIAVIDENVVTIESTIFGKPSFAIVSLGDTAIREATQRLYLDFKDVKGQAMVNLSFFCCKLTCKYCCK